MSLYLKYCLLYQDSCRDSMDLWITEDVMDQSQWTDFYVLCIGMFVLRINNTKNLKFHKLQNNVKSNFKNIVLDVYSIGFENI